MNLDPSLAFTAILEMWPEGLDHEDSLSADLARAMTAANPKDRWAFAREWLAPHIAAARLAVEDRRGAPYVVPSWDSSGKQIPVDYHLALAIARSRHPSRVVAITNVYRYARFTEITEVPGDTPVVAVHLFGQHIATFRPEGVELWTRGYATPSTTEALGNLVTGGYFYTDSGTVMFSDYASTGSHRTGQRHSEGSLYPYRTREV